MEREAKCFPGEQRIGTAACARTNALLHRLKLKEKGPATQGLQEMGA